MLAYDEVPNKLPVKLPVKEPVVLLFKANEAVDANEALTAFNT